MLRQVVLSANRLTSYAYARHVVADCPKGQFRDPTPPRGRGAYGVVAEGDAHAALALHATLDRARRVALTGAATFGWRHLWRGRGSLPSLSCVDSCRQDTSSIASSGCSHAYRRGACRP